MSVKKEIHSAVHDLEGRSLKANVRGLIIGEASKTFTKSRKLRLLTLPGCSWLFEQSWMDGNLGKRTVSVQGAEYNQGVRVYSRAQLKLLKRQYPRTQFALHSSTVHPILSRHKAFGAINESGFDLIWLDYMQPFCQTARNDLVTLAGNADALFRSAWDAKHPGLFYLTLAMQREPDALRTLKMLAASFGYAGLGKDGRSTYHIRHHGLTALLNNTSNGIGVQFRPIHTVFYQEPLTSRHRRSLLMGLCGFSVVKAKPGSRPPDESLSIEPAFWNC